MKNSLGLILAHLFIYYYQTEKMYYFQLMLGTLQLNQPHCELSTWFHIHMLLLCVLVMTYI